jgi:integrase
MPRLRFHDLRSMAATALIEVGTNIRETQTRMGHTNARVTLELYGRATEEADRRAAEAVGDYLRPGVAHRARARQ